MPAFPRMPRHYRTGPEATPICGAHSDGRNFITVGNWKDVDCIDCLRVKDDPELRVHREDSAKQDALIHYTPDGIGTECGATVDSTEGILMADDPSVASCPVCRRVLDRKRQQDALGSVHHVGVRAKTDGRTDCGEDPEGVSWNVEWRKVTCPDCRGTLADVREEEKPRQLWPHDCYSCTMLGEYTGGGKTYDLYWCPLTGTPIARYGEHGDYLSGMAFVTREPVLALAYLKALHRGLVNFDLKDL